MEWSIKFPNGELSAMYLPGKKRVALVLKDGTGGRTFAYFHSEAYAKEFLETLWNIMGAEDGKEG